jgi:hypothetical protein
MELNRSAFGLDHYDRNRLPGGIFTTQGNQRYCDIPKVIAPLHHNMAIEKSVVFSFKKFQNNSIKYRKNYKNIAYWHSQIYLVK